MKTDQQNDPCLVRGGATEVAARPAAFSLLPPFTRQGFFATPTDFYGDMIQAPELTGDEDWLCPFWEGDSWDSVKIDQARAVAILVLRSMDYWGEYLWTNHWQSVRARTMRLAGWSCAVCGQRADDADHFTYKRRGFERSEDVMALCRVCHITKHEAFAARTRSELFQNLR
jgi:hypothetical protein